MVKKEHVPTGVMHTLLHCPPWWGPCPDGLEKADAWWRFCAPPQTRPHHRRHDRRGCQTYLMKRSKKWKCFSRGTQSLHFCVRLILFSCFPETLFISRKLSSPASVVPLDMDELNDSVVLGLFNTVSSLVRGVAAAGPEGLKTTREKKIDIKTWKSNNHLYQNNINCYKGRRKTGQKEKKTEVKI